MCTADPDLELDAQELAAQVRDLFAQRQRLSFQLGEVLSQIHEIGVGPLFGFGRVDKWLEELLGLGKQEAEKIDKRAVALTGQGPDFPPRAPVTAEAAREGALSDANIDLIIEALRKKIPAEHHDFAEPLLVDLARVARPREVETLVEQILGYVNPDGPEPDDRPPRDPERVCWLTKKRNGRWHLDAEVDEVSGAIIESTLDALATKRTGDDGPDRRAKHERYGDALHTVFTMAADDDKLPKKAGERAHITVVVPWENLRDQVGTATLDLDRQISAWEARLMACDSTIIPVCLGKKGEVLDLGRKQRLIVPGQRKALYLRDKGCAFPGCNQPPRHCDGHHVVPWEHGGPTDLCNLVLLCEHHHRVIHRTAWTVRIAQDGLPEFLPPPWLDPDRRPRRNTTHPPLAL